MENETLITALRAFSDKKYCMHGCTVGAGQEYCPGCGEWDFDKVIKLMIEAADAIEKLDNEVMLYRAVGSVTDVTSMKEWMDMSINDIRKNTLEFMRQMREIVAEHEAQPKKRKRRT